MLRRSSLLAGLNKESPGDQEEALRRIGDDRQQRPEWWALRLVLAVDMAREALEENDAQRAAWDMLWAASIWSMLVFLQQLELLVKIKQGAAVAGIDLDVSFDDTIHDRSIVTDTGWKILLGRGLDMFQYVTGDAFDLATKLQEYRHVKAFGVTYIREVE